MGWLQSYVGLEPLMRHQFTEPAGSTHWPDPIRIRVERRLDSSDTKIPFPRKAHAVRRVWEFDAIVSITGPVRIGDDVQQGARPVSPARRSVIVCQSWDRARCGRVQQSRFPFCLRWETPLTWYRIIRKAAVATFQCANNLIRLGK